MFRDAHLPPVADQPREFRFADFPVRSRDHQQGLAVVEESLLGRRRQSVQVLGQLTHRHHLRLVHGVLLTWSRGFPRREFTGLSAVRRRCSPDPTKSHTPNSANGPAACRRWSLRLLKNHVALTENIPKLDHSTIGRVFTKARVPAKSV
ncbi:hypothetical protein D5S19_30785 [Amycolatopsis panacis]|uniref:Uncharacterized protein n=1 Tax=Amycolatopsis panacis TaxID=2340917 RepID=A0A419HJR4_9PSEU|nr:hypothetical protein D5S19_30785 [Amycolatopsis panacis]